MNSFGGPPQMYAGKPDPDRSRRVDQLQVEFYSRRNILGKVKHYWRVRHENSEIMAQGQGYSDPRDRDSAVKFLWPDLPEPVDLDDK